MRLEVVDLDLSYEMYMQEKVTIFKENLLQKSLKSDGVSST